MLRISSFKKKFYIFTQTDRKQAGRVTEITQTKRGCRVSPSGAQAPHNIPPILPAKQRLCFVYERRLPVLPSPQTPRLTLAGQCGYPFILAKTKSPAMYSRGRGRAISLEKK